MKKRGHLAWILRLTVVAVLFGSVILPAGADPAGEGGAEPVIVDFPAAEEDSSWYDPNQTVYDIATPAQLAYFGRLLNEGNVSFSGKTVRLTQNIVWNEGTATETGFSPASADNTVIRWNPMGSTSSPSTPFMGTFDGQGYSISGLYISKNENNVGFFNMVKDSTIKNLSIVNTYLSVGSGKWYAGTLAVQAMGSKCVFENIFVEAYHNHGSAVQFVGGILGTVGPATETTFRNCVFDGYLTGTAAVGGILGTNRTCKTELTDCVNYGTLKTTKETGGIIGRCSGDATLVRCHNFGNMQVTNDSYAGALLYLERKNHNTNLTAEAGSASVSLTDCWFFDSAFPVGGALALHNGRFWFTVEVLYTGSEAQKHICVGGATGEERIAENKALSAMCRSIALPETDSGAAVDILGCQERRPNESCDVRIVGMRLPVSENASETDETAKQTGSPAAKETVGFSWRRLSANGLSDEEFSGVTEEDLEKIDADYGTTEVFASEYNADSFFTLEETISAYGMELILVRSFVGEGEERLYGDCVLIVYVNGMFLRADRV